MNNPLPTRPRRLVSLVVVLCLALSACGPFSGESTITVTAQPVAMELDDDAQDSGTTDVVLQAIDTIDPGITFEPANQSGRDPFSGMLLTTRANHDSGDEVDANTREPGLYGGSGDALVCDVPALVSFLSENDEKAAAWADTLGITAAEVGDYIATLTPLVLDQPARVTNHGYSNGVARPFQAELATSTAVLVDDKGAPRVRCACGNPLGDPQDPGPAPDPTPAATQTPIPTATPAPEDDGPGIEDVRDPQVLDFCATWAAIAPSIVGSPGPGGLTAYLENLVTAFDALIAAAEREPGFPEWAMDDFTAYHADLVYALETNDLTAGDAAVRGRVEGFLVRYCGPLTDAA